MKKKETISLWVGSFLLAGMMCVGIIYLYLKAVMKNVSKKTVKENKDQKTNKSTAGKCC